MVNIPRITVGEAATLINAIIFVIQTTLALALVILFAWAVPSINSAVSWSLIARTLHSSWWPTILRSDSTSSRGEAGFRFTSFSALFFLSSGLVSLAGLITPLGLNAGPLVQFGYDSTNASHVVDLSPIGLSTSPRDKYTFNRICGAQSPLPCPGNGNNGNTSDIAPSVIKIFNSTNQGPFNMEFRRYYQGVAGYNYSVTKAKLSTAQSLLLRNDVFAISGLVVDMSNETPGVGLWNPTLPETPRGGVWTQDMLWLEPVTTCVNTNLTIDYMLTNGPYSGIDNGNLTDRGGFVNLTTQYPFINTTAQEPNLYDHAYKGAVLSNLFSLLSFSNATYNMTRDDSYLGKPFPLRFFGDTTFTAGYMQPLRLMFLTNATKFTKQGSTDISCQGWGGGDNANATNIGVHCTLFLGTPQRTDGGNPLLPGDNSTWSQTLHACASATRARLQRVHFSFNGTRDLSGLRIVRENISTPSLWAVERTTLNISDIDLFWGRVSDEYENDPSLYPIRSDVFYVPAGGSDTWGVIAPGQPTTVLSTAWTAAYSRLSDDLGDIFGKTDFALNNKHQSLVRANPIGGHAQILNLIWTDLVANNLVSTNMNTTLYVARNQQSVVYNWKYGIPALILIIFWFSTLLVAFFALATGRLKLSYLRRLLNHTSAGRIVTGHSALRLADTSGTRGESGVVAGDPGTYPMANAVLPCPEKDWEKSAGQSPVALTLSPAQQDSRGAYEKVGYS